MSAETKPASNSQQFNIRLPAELKDRLETYAQLVGRPQTTVASEALADYLAWRVPQIEALKQSIDAADRGEFASAEEVEAFFKRYEA
jgi:RHH-type transcriptional regulator, rel operon repressor / antitoxin RelB